MPGSGDSRYASFVSFNKAYSTDVNKCVHCVSAGQYTTGLRHTRDDCKLGGWEPRLACCMCNNYQQAINTRATPRFLLQSVQYSPVCGHTGSQCFDEGDRGNWADRWFHGTRVGHTGPGCPSTRVLTSLERNWSYSSENVSEHCSITGIQSTRTQSQLVPKSTRTHGQLVPKYKRNAK